MNWRHGVFIGASVSSEATAAAEHKVCSIIFIYHYYSKLLLICSFFPQGRTIMHDPFAMRPFFGYNAGHYLDHWYAELILILLRLFKILFFVRRSGHRLSMEKPGRKLPKIFHVNWFRRSEDVNYFLRFQLGSDF